MIEINCDYSLKDDVAFILETEMISALELSERTGISRTTLNAINRSGLAREDVCEKLYSFIYNRGYRMNSVKEELLKESSGNVLFHGSRNGLSEISVEGSRDNCDFGKGFYLGETYDQALSFVCEKRGSSVYSFRYTLGDLKIKRFECDLEWMLAICHYRGALKAYRTDQIILNIVKEINDADVIIAPIADNKMFFTMSQFTEGEINADVALHSLSASRLGLQYIFKTDKALSHLTPVEKYYLPEPEREDCRKRLAERSYEIDTKLKLAKREFRSGLYIEEFFK